jgi:hypothetical protein
VRTSIVDDGDGVAEARTTFSHRQVDGFASQFWFGQPRD